MRKTFLKLGLILGAALAFTNCTKELETPLAPEEVKGEEFELCALVPETKTVNDGLNTNWKLNDKLAVFYGAAGTETFSAGLVYNCDVAETGHFKGNLDAKLPLAESNDWYAFYSSAINSKGELNASFTRPTKSTRITFGTRTDYENPVQKQDGVNSTKHINGDYYPLYGELKGVASDVLPGIKMAHLSTLVKVDVENMTSHYMNVDDVEIETPAGQMLVGLFTYEVKDGKQTLTPYTGQGTSGKPSSSNIARLEAKDAIIAPGERASFYIGTVPFSLEAGKSLKVRVNGYEKVLTFNKSVEFKAGMIKALPVFPYAPQSTAIADGTYVIAAKDVNGDFYALKNVALSKRLAEVNIGKVNSQAKYEAIDKGLLWNVNVVDGICKVKDQDKGNLSWNTTDKGNTAMVATKEFALNAYGDHRGFFMFDFAEEAPSTVVRVLAWNKTSKGFAFYDASKTTMDKKLYLIPAEMTKKTFLAKPKVTLTPDAAASKITVSWESVPNATSYVVTCTGQTAKTVTATSVDFTGLTVGDTYEFTVTAKADPTKFIDATSDPVEVALVAAGTKSFNLTIGGVGTGVPQGVKVSAATTSKGSATQITGGNSQTYTVKGMAGKTITGVTLSMRSNKSKGAGYLTLTAGSQTLATIGTKTSGIAFNQKEWHGAWEGSNFVPVDLAMTNTTYKIKANEDVVLVVGATANSLYCENITVYYTE